MLFCIGCQKEKLGTQYVSGQNTYNTHVRMVLVTEIPREPLESILIEIQNDTDLYVDLQGKFDMWQFEKWEGGKWVKIPVGTRREDFHIDVISPQSKKTFQYFFGEPLEKGCYRLQHSVLVHPDARHFEEEESFECMVEVYFNVFPGAPGATA